jgi:CHAT domain-containing protein/tetratricopeptide (TPR) repeat protein
MSERKDIESLIQTILDSTEAGWDGLCEQLIDEYSSDGLQELADQLKLHAFDHLLHTNLEQAQHMANFIQRLGETADCKWIHGLGLLARADAVHHGGQPGHAMALFEESGRVFLQAGDRVGWARARGGWAVSATYAGLIREQDLVEMNEARQVFRATGNLYRLAMMEQDIGLAWQKLGNFQAAISTLEQALATLGPGTTPAESRLRGMILANTATTFLWVSDLARAASLFQQARALFLETGSSSYASLTEMHLSIIERLHGHWRTALHLLQSAIEGLRLAKLPTETALALTYQADLLLALNRYEEGVVAATEAVTLLREVEAPLHFINACSILARALYRCNDIEGALASLLEGERLAATTETLQVDFPLALERASLLLSSGRAREAKEVALAFLKTPVTEETTLQRHMALLIVAEATFASGDITLANSLAREIIKQSEQLEVPESRYRGYLALARAAYRSGDLSTALEYYDNVTSTLHSLQIELVYDQRSGFLEDKETLYQEALSVALEKGNPLKALAYLEQRRTRASWRMLSRRNEETADAELEDQKSAVELETLLMRHRLISQSVLTLPEDSPVRAGARGELKRLAAQVRDIQEAHAQKVGTITALDGEDILKTIPEGRTVLAYALLKDDLIIFVITGQSVLAERVKGGVEELHKLDRFLQLLEYTTMTTGYEHSPWKKLLHKFWSLLIAPVARHLPMEGETLTIIPSGLMHGLPLSALYDGERYLTERWVLHCVPSFQALDRIADSTTEVSRSILALGYSDEGKLPDAPTEAYAVAALIGGEALVEDEASGKRLQQEGAGRTFLHFAAHAAFRLDTPHSSFLQLADGPFHPTDVLTLDLRGCHLVTLSACRTAIGRPSGGDEQIGLTRAFHFAGAEAVLATLWRVDDASTFAFMREFYQRLARDFSPVEALHSAQLACIQSAGETSQAHPYFWAGFQLMTYVNRMKSHNPSDDGDNRVE